MEIGQQHVDRQLPSPGITLRVDEERQRAHHQRHKRIGMVLTLACFSIGMAAPLLSVYLAIVSMVQAIGLLFGIDMWGRAQRGLRRTGALNVALDGPRITVWHDGAAPLVVSEPVMSAVAYPDFLMLVTGTDCRSPHQIELAPPPPERDAMLRSLAENGVLIRSARYTRGVEIVFALTVVPLLVALGYVAYRVLALAALGGLLYLLHQLPASIGIALFLLLAAGGLLLLLVRLIPRAR